MEELDFIVDTNTEGDSELLKTLNSPFPIFSSSSYALVDTEDGEKTESEKSEDENDDEYFGENSKVNPVELEIQLTFFHRSSTSFNPDKRCAQKMPNQS